MVGAVGGVVVVVDGGDVVGVVAVHRFSWVMVLLELEDVLAEPVRYDLAVLFFKLHTDCFPSEVSSSDKRAT